MRARKFTVTVGTVLATFGLAYPASADSPPAAVNDDSSYELTSSIYTLGVWTWSDPSSMKTISAACMDGFHIRSTKDRYNVWVPDLAPHRSNDSVSIVGAFDDGSKPQTAMKVKLWNQTFTKQTASFSWWCDPNS